MGKHCLKKKAGLLHLLADPILGLSFKIVENQANANSVSICIYVTNGVFLYVYVEVNSLISV